MDIKYPTPKVKELAIGWHELTLEDDIIEGDYYWDDQNKKWDSLKVWVGDKVKDYRYFRDHPDRKAVRKNPQPPQGTVLTWD